MTEIKGKYEWGGKRNGSGRKPSTVKTTVSLQIDKDVADWLKTKIPYSPKINELLREMMIHDIDILSAVKQLGSPPQVWDEKRRPSTYMS